MGLLSIFKRHASGGSTVAPGAAGADADPVQEARTRARRRLIGATVLLGLGVIGFPLVFETQPRPIPVNIPIEIPAKEGQPPLKPPAARASAEAVAVPVAQERARETTPDTASAASAAAKPQSIAASARTAADEGTKAGQAGQTKAADTKAGTKAAAKPAEVKADDDQAGSSSKAAGSKPAATAQAAAKPAVQGRFVVQVGAFAGITSAREARSRLQKLGLKSYTQVVEVDGERRIRVRAGPFPTRDEAERAAERIKSAGLPAAILSL